MLARLRLLLAMSLLCLGTWCATLAVDGSWPTGATLRINPSSPAPGLSASPDTQQFISFLTRERFVVEPAPATKPRLKSQLNSQAKPQVTSELDSQLDAKPPKGAAKAAGLEKRRPAPQLPWPLSLFED
jgi:hypothetical protein